MRTHPAFSWVAASLLVFAPFHAVAQERPENSSVRDRPREEYDALGKRLGGFTLYASALLGAESTDNLFAEEIGEESDLILSVAPRARLQSNWSRHSLVAEAGGRFESHQDFSDEDAETAYGRLAGRLDVGSRSALSGSAGFAHEVEPRTDPDSTLGGPPVEYDRSDLSVGAEHTFNRFRISGSYDRTELSFDGPVQSFRDHEENAFTGRIDAELTPRIGAVLRATADEREYDNLPVLNSEGRRILAGVTVNFTDLVQGEITAGQFDRDYDTGGSIDGAAVEANLEWYVTGLTTLSFSAERNVEDTGATAIAEPYTETEYGARVDHELRRNIILTAGADFGRREYENIDREDEFTQADVGVDYLVNRRVAIEARYRFDDVQSDGTDPLVGRDFDVNTFSVGVRLSL